MGRDSAQLPEQPSGKPALPPCVSRGYGSHWAPDSGRGPAAPTAWPGPCHSPPAVEASARTSECRPSSGSEGDAPGWRGPPVSHFPVQGEQASWRSDLGPILWGMGLQPEMAARLCGRGLELFFHVLRSHRQDGRGQRCKGESRDESENPAERI